MLGDELDEDEGRGQEQEKTGSQTEVDGAQEGGGAKGKRKGKKREKKSSARSADGQGNCVSKVLCMLLAVGRSLRRCEKERGHLPHGYRSGVVFLESLRGHDSARWTCGCGVGWLDWADHSSERARRRC